MKIPCEIVVWYVLPTIRREIARELVFEHGMTQAQVARKFEVTDAAISQYLKKKRGENEIIQNSERYPLFFNEIKNSAKRLASGDADFVTEMCKLCYTVKNCGMLAEIYEQYTGYDAPQCAMADAEIQRMMLKE
jgi:predicted transcriptional regulator